MALTYKQARTFEHTQETASDTWVISHLLDIYPVIDVYVNISSTLQKIIPLNVEYTDANTCTVTFSTAYTGLATLA
jgi:hypothetical protein